MNLLQARLREAAASRLRPPANVDALFPARFVGPSGKYEAGKMADAERAKLPADAIATVQQLLLWFPEDTRLLWLLGELYNATGDIRSAEQVFEDCIGSRRFNAPPEFAEHRRIVKAAVAALAAAQPTPTAPAESFCPTRRRLWLVGGIGGLVVVLLRALATSGMATPQHNENWTVSQMPNRHTTNGIPTDRAMAARMAAARRHLVRAHPEFAPLIDRGRPLSIAADAGCIHNAS